MGEKNIFHFFFCSQLVHLWGEVLQALGKESGVEGCILSFDQLLKLSAQLVKKTEMCENWLQ